MRRRCETPEKRAFSPGFLTFHPKGAICKRPMRLSDTKGSGGGGGGSDLPADPASPSILRPAHGLIMLGVIHRDENGPGLLDRWLRAVEPHVITLEFSHYGARFRREMGPALKRRIEEVYNELKRNNLPCYDNALSMALSYIEMPYEFDTASGYGKKHGVPVHLVDMDFFSYVRLREIEEFLSPGNLERLLSERPDGRADQEKGLARLFFEKGVKPAPYTKEMSMRDKFMSNKIAVLGKYHGKKRFLHITGWRHLEDPYNLYGFLEPVKVFIYDKTFCV